MMHQLIIGAFLSVILVGCTTYTPHGNFVEHHIESHQQKVAQDVVKQITQLYPPGKTRFELQQATPDPFGAALIQGLREQGYAILEFAPERTQKQQDQTESVPLHYIFDQLTDSRLYHVAITIGDTSLTRPYSQKKGNVTPAGYWVRKE